MYTNRRVYKNWLIFHHIDAMQVLKLLSVAFNHCRVWDDFLGDFQYRLPLSELQWLWELGEFHVFWTHPEKITAPRSFLPNWGTSCAVFPNWSVGPKVLPTDSEKTGRRGTVWPWCGHTTKGEPTKRGQRKAHPAPPRAVWGRSLF